MVERGTQAPGDLATQFAARATGTKLTLPTGSVIYVRDPDLAQLALKGHIPDHLIGLVEMFIFDQQRAISTVNVGLGAGVDDDQAGVKLKRYGEFLQYLDVFTVAAIVAPQFRHDDQPGDALPISLLTAEEKMHVWRWSAGLVSALGSFPDDGGGPVADVPGSSDRENVRHAAVGAADAASVDRVSV